MTPQVILAIGSAVLQIATVVFGSKRVGKGPQMIEDWLRYISGEGMIFFAHDSSRINHLYNYISERVDRKFDGWMEWGVYYEVLRQFSYNLSDLINDDCYYIVDSNYQIVKKFDRKAISVKHSLPGDTWGSPNVGRSISDVFTRGAVDELERYNANHTNQFFSQRYPGWVRSEFSDYKAFLAPYSEKTASKVKALKLPEDQVVVCGYPYSYFFSKSQNTWLKTPVALYDCFGNYYVINTDATIDLASTDPGSVHDPKDIYSSVSGLSIRNWKEAEQAAFLDYQNQVIAEQQAEADRKANETQQTEQDAKASQRKTLLRSLGFIAIPLASYYIYKQFIKKIN